MGKQRGGGRRRKELEIIHQICYLFIDNINPYQKLVKLPFFITRGSCINRFKSQPLASIYNFCSKIFFEIAVWDWGKNRK